MYSQNTLLPRAPQRQRNVAQRDGWGALPADYEYSPCRPPLLSSRTGILNRLLVRNPRAHDRAVRPFTAAEHAAISMCFIGWDPFSSLLIGGEGGSRHNGG